MRWTIVPLDQMWDKASHDKMAIDYGCWNIGRFNCNEFDFHRDCNYDRQNEAFSKMLHIPPIYPDGDYVLGFTWYGGGEGYGHFGDYYDCSYIRIEGGDRLESEFVPTFRAGGGSKYEDTCEATVDSLGVCWKEPCIPIRKTSPMVPRQFRDGATPPAVKSSWFAGGINAHNASVTLKRLHLVDAKKDAVLDNDLSEIVALHRDDEITLLAETTGDVDYVQWYTNGVLKGRDYNAPYTIAGDFRGDFYPWMHPLFNRRIRVSAKVVAKDGSYCWTTLEIRFAEVKDGGVQTYSGTSWDDFTAGNPQYSGENNQPKAAQRFPNPNTASPIVAPPTTEPKPVPVQSTQTFTASTTASSGGSKVGISRSKRSSRSDLNPIIPESVPSEVTREQKADDNIRQSTQKFE